MLKYILSLPKYRFSKTVKIASAILVLSTLFSPVYAQSGDRDNPTPLTSSEVSGKVDENNKSELFYSFVASPGEVVVTLDVQPNEANIIVEVELFDLDAKQLLAFEIQSYNKSIREVRRINIGKKQPVIMRINRNKFIRGTATYRVRVNGSVILPNDQKKPGSTSTLNLPPKGILRLETNDGKVQEINLDQVRKATVRE